MASMDFVFTVASATGGTITLTSSPFSVREYAMTSAEAKAPTVAETMELRVMDGASAANLDEIRKLNNLLRQAEDVKNLGAADPVYLTWQEAAGSAVWRSELVNGRAGIRNDALDYPYWTNDAAFMPLFFERKNYWEAGADVQVPLTNPNGSNNTSGLVVYNCSDAAGTAPTKRVNYVDVAGTSITGDLPAACRLEVTNTYNNEARTGTLWVANNIHSSPASLPHILEGETSSTGSDYTAAGVLSGGNSKTSPTWTGTAETTLFTFALSTALLNAMRGNWARLIAVWAQSPDINLVTVRVKIMLALSVIYESPPVVLDGQMVQDLSSLRLPPYLIRQGDLYPLTLVITAQHANTGSHSLLLDFLQISPVDGWRKYESIGYNLPYGSRLVDDGIEGRLYADGFDVSGAAGHYNAEGNPLRLSPGLAQRLYFIAKTDTGGYQTDRTHTIKLFYRPRRLTL